MKKQNDDNECDNDKQQTSKSDEPDSNKQFIDCNPNFGILYTKTEWLETQCSGW